jgi:uncharacterized protein YkwD
MNVARQLFLGMPVFLGMPAIVLTVACSSPSAPDAATREPDPSPTPVAAALIDLTNRERGGAGLPALRADGRLMQAAQLQAEQVAAAGRLEHTLADARYPHLSDRLAAAGYEWQAAGENLAFGSRDAAHAVEGWMQSAGHRANILNATYTEIGTAYLVDPNGRPYYVQVFARPRR